VPKKPGAKQPPLAESKNMVIGAIASGAKVRDAMASVGRSEETYNDWRKKDEIFRLAVDSAREVRATALERSIDPGKLTISFEQFRKTFLYMDTYRHQRAWIDLIEGREYEPIEGETYVPGSKNRILINTPPFHAKSSTLTIDYPVYRVCMNPNTRIIIVSKTQAQAKKFLYAIKLRLTDRRWAALQAAYAPDGGFSGQGEWSQNKIYVGSADSGEKDPTIEALGIGGQIYGARADLIILDDVADRSNAHEWDKHISWLDQEVANRLYGGTLLAVGTRVGAQDVYSELMNPDRYLQGKSPWTHLAQPAVLAYADDTKDWQCLWPRSSRPLDLDSEEVPDSNGEYRAWDGPKLSDMRESIAPKTWSLIYQQQAQNSSSTFSPTCVWASVNRARKPGPLRAGALGHPKGGGEGLFTIASMDPAMTGETFTLVEKVERGSKKRYVENAWVQASPSPTYIRDIIKSVTIEYSVNEWVIEQNAFQLFLVRDPEITTFLASRGVRLTPHYTSKNKIDPDFGVASVAPLFGSTRKINDGAGREVHNGDNLISLPDPEFSPGIKALIEELMIWIPGKRGKELRQDGPMALWFAELRAREILGDGREQVEKFFYKSKFTSRNGMRSRYVVPVNGYVGA